MTEEQKQALIEWLKPQIDELQNVSDEIPFGLDSDSAMHLNTMRVALAALTAPPVKLMDCDFGAVSHMSGGSKDYCNGFVDGTQNAIKAIRADGYQVEGE